MFRPRVLIFALSLVLCIVAAAAPRTGHAGRDPSTVCEEGIQFALAGRFAVAESVFTTLLASVPARAFNNLGNVHLWRGKPKLALEFYRAAMEVDSADAGIRLNSATALLLAGEESAAHIAAIVGLRRAGGLEEAAGLFGLRAPRYDEQGLSKSERDVLTREGALVLLHAMARIPEPEPPPAARNTSPGIRSAARNGSGVTRVHPVPEGPPLVYWKR